MMRMSGFILEFQRLMTVPAFGLLVLLLSGCSGSPPIRFHTLTPSAGANNQTATDERIKVESVSVPPQVNRSELVIRQDESRLIVLESDWWGASLPEEIRSALVTALDRPDSKAALMSAWIDITRFDAIPGKQAWLDTRIRLVNHADQASLKSLTCNTRIQSSTGTDTTSVVLSQQANIKTLAERIEALASQLKAGNGRCPP